MRRQAEVEGGGASAVALGQAGGVDMIHPATARPRPVGAAAAYIHTEWLVEGAGLIGGLVFHPGREGDEYNMTQPNITFYIQELLLKL